MPDIDPGASDAENLKRLVLSPAQIARMAEAERSGALAPQAGAASAVEADANASADRLVAENPGLAEAAGEAAPAPESPEAAAPSEAPAPEAPAPEAPAPEAPAPEAPAPRPERALTRDELLGQARAVKRWLGTDAEVSDADHAPQWVKDEIAAGRMDGAENGAFDPVSGRLWLNEGRAVETTAAHEVWHGTVEWAKRNAPELHRALMDIGRSAPESVKAQIREWYAGSSADVQAEEAAAYLFELTQRGRIDEMLRDEASRTWWTRLKEAFLRIIGRASGGEAVDVASLAKLDGADLMDAIGRFYAGRGTLAGAQAAPAASDGGRVTSDESAAPAPERPTPTERRNREMDPADPNRPVLSAADVAERRRVVCFRRPETTRSIGNGHRIPIHLLAGAGRQVARLRQRLPRLHDRGRNPRRAPAQPRRHPLRPRRRARPLRPPHGGARPGMKREDLLRALRLRGGGVGIENGADRRPARALPRSLQGVGERLGAGDGARAFGFRD